MPKITPPPEGWREAIAKHDECIGYILRRAAQEGDKVITQEMVVRVLRLDDDYQKVKQR